MCNNCNQCNEPSAQQTVEDIIRMTKDEIGIDLTVQEAQHVYNLLASGGGASSVASYLRTIISNQDCEPEAESKAEPDGAPFSLQDMLSAMGIPFEYLQDAEVGEASAQAEPVEQVKQPTIAYAIVAVGLPGQVPLTISGPIEVVVCMVDAALDAADPSDDQQYSFKGGLYAADQTEKDDPVAYISGTVCSQFNAIGQLTEFLATAQ